MAICKENKIYVGDLAVDQIVILLDKIKLKQALLHKATQSKSEISISGLWDCGQMSNFVITVLQLACGSS